MARCRPLLLTVGISLEFPDGDLMFDEVDEVVVRFKSGFAMSGGGQGDDGGRRDVRATRRAHTRGPEAARRAGGARGCSLQ